ncbi:MAG: hypothetical protein ACOY4O_10580 [Pseudomonadota bacterium]
MTSADYVIFSRVGLSLILAFGGIAAIFWGYRLFANGSGIAKAVDKFDFKSEAVKVSAAGMSVGGVLMLTSGFWGWLAYSSAPKYEIAGDFLKISKGQPTINYASGSAPLIGSQVLTAKKEPAGEITNILIGMGSKPAGLVIDLKKMGLNKKVVLDASRLEASNYGSFETGLSKSQFEALKEYTGPNS